MNSLQEIADFLKTWSGPMLVVAHTDPDGDAIGSVLGFARGLKSLGKDARAISTAPRYLQFLDERKDLEEPLPELPKDALLVVLDCGDAGRVSGVPLQHADGTAAKIINIDHHGTNPNFGMLNCVAPEKAATSFIVQELLALLGVQFTEEISTPLLCGIITDTGSFRFRNTSPELLRCAASLVESGARLVDIHEMLAVTPRNQYKLQAEVLSSMAFPFDGLAVTAFVNDAMLQRTGTTWEDVESFVGLIRNSEGSQLAVLLKDKGATTKVSLRSRGNVSAQNIAVALGGGGHVAAAGVTIHAPYRESQERVLEAAKAELKRAGLL